MTITAPPTMQKIATELGISVVGLNLRDSRVMNLLMGTTSGNVNLLAAIGKSNLTASRPSTYSGTYLYNPTYAYDTGTSIIIDGSTATNLDTGHIITYSGMSGGSSKLGTLYICYLYDLYSYDDGYSGIVIEYSINGGANWTIFLADYVRNDSKYHTMYSTGISITAVPSSVRVRITMESDTWGGTYSRASIYDIVFIA